MDESVLKLIDAALAEDVGSGDVTSLYFVPEEARVRAFVVARDEGVLAGGEVAREVFHRVAPGLEVELLLKDGVRLGKGARVMEVRGAARSVLTAERTALNFLQRMCGVATLTRQYVDRIQGARARILDTRKTTPGWRLLEKSAVVAGGGTNHRMGLYDRAMVKDNHLVTKTDLVQLQESIRRLKRERPGIEVELEADTLKQVRDFLGLDGVDYILLDNMEPSELREAVEMRGKKGVPRLEASGGVTLETVAAIAASGVDFVSVGAITHSAVSLDLALDFVESDP
ncbi:carboxylating nicotinate-nucleotide diphosphorylase [Haloferula sp. A504]|uniref:carboxylating nicotinate-nucleotide diphosphorylase n=1 Tax=Haloferula sp. A504 TaxID=3373601 RepID=UPI0031CABD97|nr:carboxylating nicotinate-nucleotide diphosphorylase [Verrucomicrobiaceae bacterium E54]